MLAVIIPTLNAESCLRCSLPALGGETVIVSDGGSSDKTLECALERGAALCLGSAGRGPQAGRGVTFALMKDADWLLIIHSDTKLPKAWRDVVQSHIDSHANRVGFFRYAQQAKGWRPWLQSRLVALRCWAWKLPYGDQGLLISRKVYEEIGGYSDLPLFEDVDIMNRLKSHIGRGRIRALPASVRTDVSAYERQGWLKRGWRNFRLMRSYQKGVSVADLMKIYYND